MPRHLHFDCFSGVSGDMILGALVDAGLPFTDLVRGLARLPVKGFRLTRETVERGALRATKVDVVIAKGFDKPLTLAQIKRIVSSSTLPAPVKAQSQAVFDLLAEAEGRAHGVDPAKVHFHEVGVIDSFVDVVGGVLGLHLLGAQRITASPINVGSGTLHSSHGALPVPGPAVAELTVGIPIFVQGPARELATPTGVALVRTLATEFGPLPPMQVRQVGYGAGTADPPQWPNVLRVFLGDTTTPPVGMIETIVELQTNLDDLNPQVYETVAERLFAAGALDVTLAPISMKKGRPGTLLSVLAPREKSEAALAVLFADTTALGVRTQDVQRRVLPRRFTSVVVDGHAVRIKSAEHAHGHSKASPEYDDCRAVAERTGRPVKDVLEAAMLKYRADSHASGPAKRRRP